MKPLRGCETLKADRTVGMGTCGYERGCRMLLAPQAKGPQESNFLLGALELPAHDRSLAGLSVSSPS